MTLELVIIALPGVDKVHEPLSFESVQVAPWTFEVTVIFCEFPDIVEAHDVNKINDVNNKKIFFIIIKCDILLNLDRSILTRPILM